jgi:hypothetical protein
VAVNDPLTGGQAGESLPDPKEFAQRDRAAKKQTAAKPTRIVDMANLAFIMRPGNGPW